MTFISYAQNFEDVILWRTLKLFGPGQYIDVGANHPVIDSVTLSLYQRGWRGINVEPVPHFHQLLVEQRPDEVNLCTAVGRDTGTLAFYENQNTGLSTLDNNVAEFQRQQGYAFTEKTVITISLADICDQYLDKAKPFHFLKIDVEGFEQQVIDGMDFHRWRPWLILIEAPFNRTPDWEAALLDAGYQLAYKDGLNNFYLAQEHPELKHPLSMPPNILDGFVLCEGHSLSAPIKNPIVSTLPTREPMRQVSTRQLFQLLLSRLFGAVRSLGGEKLR
ncbi:MAG: FkbM family methyltransferase [Hahellaceae bacterium]|nr:FkbM family methyltransferase [Hahellaceae bacterium]